MSPYQKLKQKLEALNQQIEKARASEIDQVIRDIRATMDLYQLTPSDLETPAERAQRLGPVRRGKRIQRMSETTQMEVGHLSPYVAKNVGRPVR